MAFLQEVLAFVTSSLTIAGWTLPFTLLEALLTTALPILALVILRPLLGSVARRIWRLAFWLIVVSLVGRLFGAESLSYLGTFFGVLNQPFYSSGGTEISVVTLLLLIPIFYAASWAFRTTRRAVDRSVLERLPLDPAQRFSVSSRAVLFGVLGIGVGFGLQSTVANFFAGLVIVLSHPIKEGDRIFVNGYEGTVQHIRVVSTVSNTITNESLIIPNSQLVDNYVHNYFFDDPRIWICAPVQVSYASDLDQVLGVLTTIAPENPYGVPGTEPNIFVRSFADSGITVSLCTKIGHTTDKNFAISWSNLTIWRRFKEAGIEIPFPQRDVHVKDWPTPTWSAAAPEGGAPASGEDPAPRD